MAISLALKMIPNYKDVIFYDAQYSMIGHYINDVVVKELNYPLSLFKFVGCLRLYKH